MMTEKCFIVESLDNRTGRIDAHFFNPLYFETIKQMEKYHKNKKNLNISSIEKLLKKSKTNLTGGATPKGTPYVTEDEGIKFIRVQNVRRYKINLEDIAYIPNAYHKGILKRSQLKPFDVLLTITGSYGFSAVVPEDLEEANINQHSVKMEINDDKIIPEYLSCFLNSELAKIQMDRLVTGGTRPALDYPSIKAINVLFPKFKEDQHNIAEKTFEMVNEAYKNFEKKKDIISAMDQKIIASLAISLPDKSSEKYFISDISDNDRLDTIFYSPYYKNLIELLKGIKHKPLRQIIEPTNKTKPNIQDFYSYIDLRYIEERTGRYKVKEVTDIGSNKIVLQDGEIFVSCLNPTKGKSFLVDDELDGCVVSTEFKPFKIILTEVIPEYLITILRSAVVLKQWQYMITGSTPSRERIGEKEVLDTLMPLPDEDIQKEIADEIGNDIKEISKLELEFNEYMKRADETFLNELKAVT